MPDDGRLVDFVPRIAVTEELRERLLVDNRPDSTGTSHERSELDDIPGTTVFTGRQSRKGYQLNQFCMSLLQPANRQRFKENESAYLDEWQLTRRSDRPLWTETGRRDRRGRQHLLPDERSSRPTARVSRQRSARWPG